MGNNLQASGATPRKQTRFAPLSVNRIFTGLWTNRSPLREGATPFLHEKFYSGSRNDSLWDDGTGTFSTNVEVSNKLTLVRRPGLGNFSQAPTFANVEGFYSFRIWQTSASGTGGFESIIPIADTGLNIQDALLGNSYVYFTKSGGGQSHFQSVGNTLYWGDGVAREKWVQPYVLYFPGDGPYAAGTTIVDPGRNLQTAVGAASGSIINYSVASNVVTLTFGQQVPFNWITGVSIQLSGFTSAAFLNGQTVTITSRSYNQITFAFTHANVGTTGDTGTVSTQATVAATGGTSFASTVNGITTENVGFGGTGQWICRGPSVEKWGIEAATAAPTVANSVRPAPYPVWTASTYYNPSLVIKGTVGNGHLQKLTGSGTTGAAEPVWAGGVTADGSAQWTDIGTAAWASLHAYSVGDIVDVTSSYWVTVPGSQFPCFSGNTEVQTLDGVRRFDALPETLWIHTERGLRLADLLVHDYDGPVIDIGSGWLVTPQHRFKRPTSNGYVWLAATEAFPDSPTSHFVGKVYNLCVRTDDEEERHYILGNGEVAHNIKAGDGEPSDGYSYQVSFTDFFQCTTAGTSGGSQPGWIDATGTTVADGTVVWTNLGPEVTWANIGATTLVSIATIVLDSKGNKEAISGPGKSGAVAPTWATVQGQTTVDGTAVWTNAGNFSGANTGTWIYSFSGLNSVTGHCSTESPISAAITLAVNDLITVQGSGFADTQVDRIRIWRTVQGGSTRLLLDDILNPGAGQTWTYSDTTLDNALNEFIQAPTASENAPPPAGLKALAYHLNRVWGAVGNSVFYSRVSDATTGVTQESFPPNNFFSFPSQVVRLLPTSLGLLVFTLSDVYLIGGTTDSTLQAAPFIQGIGLRNYNALAVNGSIIFLFTADGQLLMLDPSSGVSEVGFPIGDILSTWDSSKVSIAWHVSGQDKALYITDGVSRTNPISYRMSPTSAPETGLMWSPVATYQTPNITVLQSVETMPGQHTLLFGTSGTAQGIYKRDLTAHTDYNAVSYPARATVGSLVLAQPGQIAEVAFITTDCKAVGNRQTIGLLLDEISGRFETLTLYVPDPPRLAASSTTYANRYYLNQTQLPALCRHLMVKFDFGTSTQQEEMYSYCLFGAYHQEK